MNNFLCKIVRNTALVRYYSPDAASFTTESALHIPEEKLATKYKANQGGDINSVMLLGTLTGSKFFPMQSIPEREWALLFLRTRLPLRKSTTVSEDQLWEDRSDSLRSTSARVHVFDLRLLSHVHRLKEGDRIFVSGFLSYYDRHHFPSSTETIDAPSKWIPKICAVVAQRMVCMGSAYLPDSSSYERCDDDIEV